MSTPIGHRQAQRPDQVPRRVMAEIGKRLGRASTGIDVWWVEDGDTVTEIRYTPDGEQRTVHNLRELMSDG
ncbi:hypothetical protein ACMATS_05830 [Streptoverticillium reticulum]|uniref:hypothetical protein n=1 Tax=Streptoverticillium reticulum TaxID=1433415 RepID=UPI0039BF8582